MYNHLNKMAAFDIIRVDRWFLCLFAGVLHKTALVKIWDKLIGMHSYLEFHFFLLIFLGGSLKILTFVAVVLLTTLRRPLLGANSSQLLLGELAGISDETSEVISSNAIDLWQQYGSPLLVGDMRKDDAR